MEKGKLTKQDTVEKGKLTKQDTVEKEAKGKGKAKKGKGGDTSPAQSKAEQLLDLNSSWDSTAQTSPGISSFAKDTSQMLQPLKPVVEEGEAPPAVAARRASARSPSPPTRPIPKPRSASVSPEPLQSEEGQSAVRKYSVARLSQLFDRGMSPVQSQGWSSSIQPATSPSPTPHTPSPTSKPSTDLAQVKAAHEATPSMDAVAGETRYQVIYGYQAVDDTEVTVVEGDMVTFVPREDASPGWLMVRIASGAEGWVPESYLQLFPAKEGRIDEEGVTEGVASENEDVSKETGQVLPMDHQASPVQTSCK